MLWSTRTLESLEYSLVQPPEALQKSAHFPFLAENLLRSAIGMMNNVETCGMAGLIGVLHASGLHYSAEVVFLDMDVTKYKVVSASMTKEKLPI